MKWMHLPAPLWARVRWHRLPPVIPSVVLRRCRASILQVAAFLATPVPLLLVPIFLVVTFMGLKVSS